MSLRDDLQWIIASHSKWNQRFSEFMAEKIDLDASIVVKNDLCRTGKWLGGDDSGLPKSDLKELRRLHRDFHKTAAKVIKKKKGGDTAGAEEELNLGGALSNTSAALVSKLMEVYEGAP